MKLTWFGNRAFRLHAGGQIVVVYPDTAPLGIERTELTGGADRVIDAWTDLPRADIGSWRPRAPQRLLDAADTVRPPDVWITGSVALIIDADDERPVLLSLAGEHIPSARWIESAIVVLAGEGLAHRATALLAQSPPRFIALAGHEAEIDDTFAAVRDRLDRTGLVALEPGLAIEL